jgi:hypothetical protein
MPWLKMFLALQSPQRLRLFPGQVHGEFLVYKMENEEDIFRVLLFSLVHIVQPIIDTHLNTTLDIRTVDASRKQDFFFFHIPNL